MRFTLVGYRGDIDGFIKRENSDGSELSPFAVLLLLLLGGSIGFSLFNKFKGSSEDETKSMPEFDKSSISAYERIDEEVDGLKQEGGFEGKSIEEKKDIIINRLIEGIRRGIIIEWDNPSAYGLGG